MVANCLITKALWSVLNKWPASKVTWHGAAPASRWNKRSSQLIWIGLNLRSVVGKGYVQISSELFFSPGLNECLWASQSRKHSIWWWLLYKREKKRCFKQTSCSNDREFFLLLLFGFFFPHVLLVLQFYIIQFRCKLKAVIRPLRIYLLLSVIVSVKPNVFVLLGKIHKMSASTKTLLILLSWKTCWPLVLVFNRLI